MPPWDSGVSKFQDSLPGAFPESGRIRRQPGLCGVQNPHKPQTEKDDSHPHRPFVPWKWVLPLSL